MSDKAARVRQLNDQFRTTMTGGQVLITPGVAELPLDVQATVIRKVATFNEFSEDNDPHGEHDFGSFDLIGRTFFWKIDYYDANLEYGSEDPGDPEQTARILTIMLAEEY